MTITWYQISKKLKEYFELKVLLIIKETVKNYTIKCDFSFIWLMISSPKDYLGYYLRLSQHQKTHFVLKNNYSGFV